jgi:opacity protein-like surface antigen
MVRPGALVVATIMLASGGVEAQQADRDGRWEASVQLVTTDSEDVSGDNQSSIDIDNAVGLGFGAAYNVNDTLALGANFTFLEPDYKAVFNTDQRGLVSVDHEMDVYNVSFDAIWNLTEGPLTPFLRLGLGWTYVDSNIADGPPVTGCWWDPWYGYICQGFYPTYDDTSFSYGFGAGLRFEFGNGWFVKGSINRLQVDADNGFDPSIDSARFELGWLFW